MVQVKQAAGEVVGQVSTAVAAAAAPHKHPAWCVLVQAYPQLLLCQSLGPLKCAHPPPTVASTANNVGDG